MTIHSLVVHGDAILKFTPSDLPVIFLMGPTASGKTAASLAIAKHFPVEIISVDSALVYQDMDIGTAKPSPETLSDIPHHLINLISPTETYSAAQFRADAHRLIFEVHHRGRIPLLVGGTMLYFNALQHGLSDLPMADSLIRRDILLKAEKEGWPSMHAELAKVDAETAKRLNPNDAQRIERALEVFLISGVPLSSLTAAAHDSGFDYPLLKIALIPSNRAQLHERIARRFDMMLEEGFVKEVISLRERYPTLTPELPSMRCVGYRQAWEFLDHQTSHILFREKSIVATRQLAKRQLTWLRGMKDTVTLDCLSAILESEVSKVVSDFINERQA